MQLHDSGKPSLPTIAPVTYMWRPMQQISTNIDELRREISCEGPTIDNTTSIRQLWLWIHAASFKEAYDSLSSACETNVGYVTSNILCMTFMQLSFSGCGLDRMHE